MSKNLAACLFAGAIAFALVACNTVPEPEGKSQPAASASADPTELKKEDLKVGSGDREVKSGDKILVNYKGTLLRGGKQFDANLDKNKPMPVSVGEGNVIKGWDQGLPGMKKGGKRKLTIPAALAYGEAGQPPSIPKNAALVFEIDLIGWADDQPEASASASAASAGSVEPSTSASAAPSASGASSGAPSASASAKASAAPAASGSAKPKADKPKSDK